ncbi:MAG: ribose-5-phosphate isomerase [Candidatus Levybacteria bacterium RIFCSPHIGHO2_02_FULL_39_36]|uniref:Ribose-5-phosphate isomerase B n=1 Tax=Candidatus Woesebacteria bacterium GW2011_GWA1_41_13b TaxID=1618555 RepID=A0A0G0X3G1_9BACT|nr:MAG: Ribose 5-phosphate isomerase [Microgenomates group bacterium GW2011_GWC1_39_7b]KKR49731.1 MAG: Ribose 5-phosphate isomerase [Candidatus Levybacteria bacterium GW2011_GWA2_40_16]KKR91170.1 MAG: Ribose 5-phosphate isomerase [Candidatus Woesebacteria bacterium GW2011_GWA1_41_13b]OGH14875.1 MAG: ribose-5-phosphate isomerase [Candidatus Levybacteria bacterium RIFCSPHIGHO2_01_FULL_38_96]OGH25764.1 MAG: ribose-5-phosphate isomerase [Candidatus Levybacteria bacterium RIFCSPHIGHO2_12_FULL_39_39]
MKIYLGADHAGFEFKEKIKEFLMSGGYEVEDCGAKTYEPNDDYPDFCSVAAKKTAENHGSFGIVLGKSGAGEAIVANKIKGIRAALGVNEENVRLAREHNDANVLSLGSIFCDTETAKKLAKLFLETPFSNEERHVRRVNKIRELENNQ